ncbi:phosphatase PAP2 family protein [Candidatus Uhrbacteria bacterium]|nr:phosphatase PAP2 family protein [Candidatus Uhrbacteria bacterium]
MFVRWLMHVDRVVTVAVNDLSGRWAALDVLVWVLAVLLIWILAAVAMIVARQQSISARRSMLLEMCATLVIAWSFNQVVGVVMFRERPFLRGTTTPRITMDARLKSFPSDHAALAASLVLPMLPYVRRRSLKMLLLAGVFGVAWGRMYVGVHYLSDVIAGMAVALASWRSVRWLQGRTAAVLGPRVPS